MEEKTDTYCRYVNRLEKDDINRIYHDTQYGFPIDSDDELFGRLILEINQAGLSWSTILKKQENFRKAYAGFSIVEVAAFGKADVDRLLNDEGIIRNRLKIDAAIYNANQIVELSSEYGSFKNWLDYNHPLSKSEWVKLFKETFKFTGGEITNEFLMSTGYLEGAHDEDCPVFSKILELKPMWAVGLLKKS